MEVEVFDVEVGTVPMGLRRGYLRAAAVALGTIVHVPVGGHYLAGVFGVIDPGVFIADGGGDVDFGEGSGDEGCEAGKEDRGVAHLRG